MDEKQTISRRANETEAQQLVEGNDAWTAAIAGIVGGWLVLIGSLANAVKLREKHDWPWQNMIGNPREWLFFGGILAVAVGYPVMRFTKANLDEATEKVEAKKENDNPE